MTTNPEGYMQNYIAELQMECAFLVTNGLMRTTNGEKITFPTSRNPLPHETVFHHELQLNGNRPNGKIARLLEIKRNHWNVRAMTAAIHQQFHFGENKQLQTINEKETGVA
jgi:hypothetical protein